MIKDIFIRAKIVVGCVSVILLTSFLIVVFYVATFIRKIFFGPFVSKAAKDTIDRSEEFIGSAQSQLNALKATLEKQ